MINLRRREHRMYLTGAGLASLFWWIYSGPLLQISDIEKGMALALVIILVINGIAKVVKAFRQMQFHIEMLSNEVDDCKLDIKQIKSRKRKEPNPE